MTYHLAESDLRIWSNLKFLQLTIALLIISLLTITHYKIITVILVLIAIALIGYIILDNFITLKHSYEELAYAWEGWRNATGRVMINDFKEYVDISNEVAKANGEYKNFH